MGRANTQAPTSLKRRPNPRRSMAAADCGESASAGDISASGREGDMGEARELADRLTDAVMTLKDLEAIAACYSDDAVAVTP